MAHCGGRSSLTNRSRVRFRRHMWSFLLKFSPLLKNRHFQIPSRSWNAQAFLNEFLRTPWCPVGKQITHLHFIYFFIIYTTFTHLLLHNIYRQTDRQTDRQKDRQIDKQIDKQIDRQADRQTDTQIDRQTYRPIDREEDRQTGRQTEMRKERWAKNRINRQTKTWQTQKLLSTTTTKK